MIEMSCRTASWKVLFIPSEKSKIIHECNKQSSRIQVTFEVKERSLSTRNRYAGPPKPHPYYGERGQSRCPRWSRSQRCGTELVRRLFDCLGSLFMVPAVLVCEENTMYCIVFEHDSSFTRDSRVEISPY